MGMLLVSSMDDIEAWTIVLVLIRLIFIGKRKCRWDLMLETRLQWREEKQLGKKTKNAPQNIKMLSLSTTPGKDCSQKNKKKHYYC